MASFQCSMFIKLFSYLLCFRQIPIPKIKKDKHQTETNTHRGKRVEEERRVRKNQDLEATQQQNVHAECSLGN